MNFLLGWPNFRGENVSFTEGICYYDILCRWRHILHIFPTNMDNLAIIHSLSRPFELLVGSLSIWIYLGCWFDPFISKHLRRKFLGFKGGYLEQDWYASGRCSGWEAITKLVSTCRRTRAVRCLVNMHNLLKWPRSNMLAANWLHRYSLTRWFALCFRNDWSKWHIMMQQY